MFQVLWVSLAGQDRPVQPDRLESRVYPATRAVVDLPVYREMPDPGARRDFLVLRESSAPLVQQVVYSFFIIDIAANVLMAQALIVADSV